ncbi:hypothetical protein CASFOL_023484 [Castilleja foliolosa]|uniref:Uncharacterized protein n=1 Tax=Castilleja foliolosa TaxID=1961234 RepID=A0ABD3CKQ0_9LAMI
MEDILTQLKKEMAAPHNHKLVQPPEGTYVNDDGGFWATLSQRWWRVEVERRGNEFGTTDLVVPGDWNCEGVLHQLASRAVLPRFYASNVRAESYVVFEKCDRKAVKSPPDTNAGAEKKSDAVGSKTPSQSSSSETQSGQTRANPGTPNPFANFASAPGMANPFDFSAMTGLLNDPSIKELAEQIAKDPSFNQMAEQLQKTFQGPAAVEESIPNFDTQQYYSTMQQVMQNPQFMTMAERLASALMQCLTAYLKLKSLHMERNAVVLARVCY